MMMSKRSSVTDVKLRKHLLSFMCVLNPPDLWPKTDEFQMKVLLRIERNIVQIQRTMVEIESNSDCIMKASVLLSSGSNFLAYLSILGFCLPAYGSLSRSCIQSECRLGPPSMH